MATGSSGFAPEVIRQLARASSVDLAGTTLFFYEVHGLEFDATGNRWAPFGPEASFPTHVVFPREGTLEGYDVVTFSARTSAECSPLSCNVLAAEMETNDTACCLNGRRSCWKKAGSPTRNPVRTVYSPSTR